MKNTIITNISELFCPHNCISCGKIGGILCERCKNDITNVTYGRCLECGGMLSGNYC